MSITVSTDVFCDRCQAWTHGVTGAQVDVRGARRQAKREGWRHRAIERGLGRPRLDLCPRCHEEQP